jgi:hypothetical protein
MATLQRCEALVVHCIDFRFHEAAARFVRVQLGLETYDLLATPGAARHLTALAAPERQAALLDDIATSLHLHAPSRLVLINHADCGAYGGQAAFASVEAEAAFHHGALRQASQLLRARYPTLAVTTSFAAAAAPDDLTNVTTVVVEEQ